MGDSSSEEVINISRREHQVARKRVLEDLFEEDEREISEESISSIDYGDRDSLFFEIFGTGEEYRYVLESDPHEVAEEAGRCDEPTPESKTVDLDKVYEYAANNMRTRTESLKKIIELVGRGYTIHFALLHSGIEDVGIEEGYEVVDIFDEYREFVDLKEKMRRRYGNDKLLQDIEGIQGLKWYSAYKKHLDKDLSLPDELLSAEDFCENIKAKKKIHEPRNSSFLSDFANEDKLIQRISLHPVFRSALYTVFRNHGIRSEKNGLDVRDDVMKRDLVDFYLSDISSEDPWNRYRERIIRSSAEKAAKEAIVPLVLKETDLREMKRRVFVEAVDRIVNGSIGIKGDGTHVCGVTREKKYLKAVTVNFEGDLVDYITVKEEEKDELLRFIEKFDPCCVAVSGSTTSIRYLMKDLSPWNPVYVESRLAHTKAEDTYSFCCNIARIIQCPEIEYSDMLEKGIVYIQQQILPRNVMVETIRKGILTAISIVGVDVNYLLNNRRKEGLLSLIPTSSSLKSSLSDLRCVMKLEDLKDLCESEVEYDNLVTYIRVHPRVLSRVSGSEILDATPVHPKNYDVVRKLCTDLCNEEGVDEKNLDPVKKALSNAKELLKTSRPKILECGDPLTIDVYKTLVDGDRPIYSGLPDHLVFKELTGCDESLIGKVVEGRISKCGNTYYLLDSNATPAAIYIRKNRGQQELFLNQLVTVRIEYMNDFLLSYTASIAVSEQKKPNHSRFMTHPLFKDLNSEQSEEYLKDHSSSILLRRSRKDCSPVVVLKVSDGIYIHMKIQEAEKYYYKGNSYDDLDEFISRVAKKMLTNFKNIKNHKYYFENEEKLLDYLNQGGSYIRYGFCLSRKYPGKLCMLYRDGRNHKEYITVDEHLVYEGRNFASLDEFVRYRKSL
ncbi:CHROMATIN STRUCTURE MODULATOR [Encephalitozoon cuniculi GB-M1]|uniref:CHROMATIN STRUCTURE MODULATOR n=1 Tax=Encephalitozoon cuniculi (strain GB-M1) TaxID=284813 RepID=Q8SRG7_ENCCU|nr:chromatin structure modulator [Encephalitozoon cuniculi GB-M1]CAD25700.1 CHROMATIN STRUCTURE MODULATOR [Encephalitozoon cuniculi GB-M1]